MALPGCGLVQMVATGSGLSGAGRTVPPLLHSVLIWATSLSRQTCRSTCTGTCGTDPAVRTCQHMGRGLLALIGPAHRQQVVQAEAAGAFGACLAPHQRLQGSRVARSQALGVETVPGCLARC